MKSSDDLAEIFKALSDPTRLRIVDMLADSGSALCVNALTNKLDVSQSAVSQHLRVLRHVGLVIPRRMGYHVHYSLNSKVLEKVRQDITVLLEKLQDK